MDASQIHDHWTDWATRYGTDLRATTKSPTAKVLELDALSRHLRAILAGRKSANVLEVGCGNGINCLALAQALPQARFDGVDYVREMVAAAVQSAQSAQQPNMRFFQGNALELDAVAGLDAQYDVVFTDRCLINLDTTEKQLRALSGLIARVRPQGDLVVIENSRSTYDEQNRCRQIVGLAPRVPASFNLFFDESAIRAHVQQLGLELVQVEDFISLHDLVLYVLVPAINGGTVDYEHPLVKVAAVLSTGMSASVPGAFGSFGQNRLFHWRKRG